MLPGLPRELHYAGPFVDAGQRPRVEFPWERLDGRPLVYASLGTLQNGSEAIFRTIAEACAGLNVQLVISLGGGLDQAGLERWREIRLWCSYAPQLEILKRAAAVITHAGLNTVLESLAEGVPLVAIAAGERSAGCCCARCGEGSGRGGSAAEAKRGSAEKRGSGSAGEREVSDGSEEPAARDWEGRWAGDCSERD